MLGEFRWAADNLAPDPCPRAVSRAAYFGRVHIKFQGDRVDESSSSKRYDRNLFFRAQGHPELSIAGELPEKAANSQPFSGWTNSALNKPNPDKYLSARKTHKLIPGRGSERESVDPPHQRR